MDYFNNTFNGNFLPWFNTKGIEILWAIFFGIIGWWFINKLRKITVILMQRANMQNSAITFLDSLSTVALRVILLLTILPHVGIDTSSIVTTFGVSLAAIGLALKDSLSNIASGILMIIYNPFHVGDYIEVGGVSGTVTKVEMMFTTLMAENNKFIIIPNAKLTSESVVRVSDYNIERCELEYKVKGDSGCDSIKKMIQRTAALNDKILQIPPLEISISDEQDTTKTVKVVFWAQKSNKEICESNINKSIKGFLSKHKLEIQ